MSRYLCHPAPRSTQSISGTGWSGTSKIPFFQATSLETSSGNPPEGRFHLPQRKTLPERSRLSFHPRTVRCYCPAAALTRQFLSPCRDRWSPPHSLPARTAHRPQSPFQLPLVPAARKAPPVSYGKRIVKMPAHRQEAAVQPQLPPSWIPSARCIRVSLFCYSVYFQREIFLNKL